MMSIRTELAAHVGGSPSATQKGLIERAAQLSLRIAAMDRKFVESGEMTEHDSRTYLGWSSALSRVLRALGLRATQTPTRSLQDHLAQRAAASS